MTSFHKAITFIIKERKKMIDVETTAASLNPRDDIAKITAKKLCERSERPPI
jgi:hypothetical protein